MYNYSLIVVVKLLNDQERDIVEIVNCVFVISLLCILGFVTNIINIAVFYKQGFKNTMNISFFGLAIADLFSLVILQWTAVCLNPWFINSDIPLAATEVQYLTGSLPHACFVRITGWITVFITAERCLCITFPLKVKQIITPRRTKVTICAIYIIIIATFSLQYATSYLDWRFFEDRNKTLIGLAFRSNKNSMENLIFYLYSISGFVSFIAVICFTVLLVVQLKLKSQWRMKANLNSAMAETITVRDRKTMSMVAIIALVLIICYTPGVTSSIATIAEPEFSVIGRYMNVFFVMWTFNFICDAANSSINIFVYYNMGSKYRETFHDVLGNWIQHLRLQVNS